MRLQTTEWKGNLHREVEGRCIAGVCLLLRIQGTFIRVCFGTTITLTSVRFSDAYSMKTVIKRMSSTVSLPAFRQEVALMWLFNDNDHIIKLFGFNEMRMDIGRLRVCRCVIWSNQITIYSNAGIYYGITRALYRVKRLRFKNCPINCIGCWTRTCSDARSWCCAPRYVLERCMSMTCLPLLPILYVCLTDIKPDNVLLEQHPTKLVHAVISDFGISNVIEDRVLTVKAFEVKNLRGLTSQFAAPEVIARFRSKDRSPVAPRVSKAGDVFSLAIVIHKLLGSVSNGWTVNTENDKL